MEVYDHLDSLIADATGTALGFTQLLCTSPYLLSSSDRLISDDQNALLRTFLTTVITVFRASLAGEIDPAVAEFLLNEAPSHLGRDFYATLPDAAWTVPVFFRTDEARVGQVVEVQCPGSLWGELQLLAEIYENAGESPAANFATELLSLSPDAAVHHLLDNCSIPHTMRYFVQATRAQGIRYYGFDKVAEDEVSFVRSHSVFGLAAENFFSQRLLRCINGSLRYDLPPLLLFDQKAPLSLPFWRKTRSFFSDDIRKCLVYTQPLSRDGFELPDGSSISITGFCALPQSKRRWYLKYAGCDIAINWGSRGVTSLGHESRIGCERRLGEALSSARSAWVLQPEIVSHHDIEIHLRGSDERERVTGTRAKFSSFYGPSSRIGSVATFRRHSKIHGQPDSAVALMVG